MPLQDRGQRGGDMVVVLDEQQSHPGLLRFIGRTVRLCTKSHDPGVRFRRVQKRGTPACTKAVTLMDEDAVKWVPVARRFRYPADTRAGHKCYDGCPIAIGS
ncbi:hypothetical protein GCM10010251_45880 [Streptomyces aurantiogriseus]|uniref:Uncharacterized protein n=1 Tax=Streptomyces aurantiogriseus TaxID=66870 RepID=A0A918CGY3_9ACTN|nr:hypothetical protein GCM10010251_45880 [Streptomyces aurantiogriseus]